MTVDELRSFVARERQASLEESVVSAMLADDALAERGNAITGLKVVGGAKGEVVMTCATNESRFRAGNKLEFRSKVARWTGTLTDLKEDGRLLRVRTACAPSASEIWVAVEQDIDLSPLIRQCLTKLQPGAPGFSYLRSLSGGATPKSKSQGDHEKLVTTIIQDGDVRLDDSQRDVVRRCLDQPSLLGCQGPPGTGKSQTLAVVAEGLARMGKRVVVLAPTHQAVNNALTVIHRTFPKRAVVKIGDELRRESLDDSIGVQILRDAVKSVPPKLTSELITGMTFVSALHHLALRSSGLGPNVVLIDEAGQLPLVQGALAGLVGAGSILLFGDDAQMPPVFSSAVADDPLATSLFAQMRKVHPDAVVMLDTTYRMNESLCRIVAENFYGDAGTTLRPSEKAAKQSLFLTLPEGTASLAADALKCPSSLVWFPTPATGCRQSNPPEADFVAEVVATAIASGVDRDRVAVVTPFRRQAAIIRSRLQSRLGTHAMPPLVDTVERVQGLTVDLIVISGVVSDPEYASMLGSFLFSPNRLNVAISRARKKAVIAFSPAAFEAVPSDYDAYLGMLKYRQVLEAAHRLA